MAAAQLSISTAIPQLFGHCPNQQTLPADPVNCRKTSSCIRIRFMSVCRCWSSSRQLRDFQSRRSVTAVISSSDYTNFMDDVLFFSKKIEDYVHEEFFEDAIRDYIQMLELGLPAEEFSSFPSLIKAFGGASEVRTAKQVHGHTLKLGVLDDISVANSILGMYWKCRSVDAALDVFNKMPLRDAVTWNTMISGFCRAGDYNSSLNAFRKMVRETPIVPPNRVACLSALSACASVCDLVCGREVHCYIIKTNMLHDQFLATTIVDMYMKCGDISSAEIVFDRALVDDSVKQNPVIWNVMISGYASNGWINEALMLLCEMLDSGTRPDSSTVVAALVSCSYSLDRSIRKQIHGLIYRLGLEIDVRVQTALIDMYFKCGKAEAGERIFETCQNANLIMWGTVISGYIQNGLPMKALDLCHRFVTLFGFADSVIVLAAVRACSSLKWKQTGTEFHGLAIKIGLAPDVFVGSALVDFYAKCGDMKCAESVFRGLSARDLISWNALISGYAQNEYADEAMEALGDMLSENIRPNLVTMASILSVCAQVSATILCKEIHCHVLRRGLESSVLVSNALISTYAKCGYLDASICVFNNMGERNQISWNSMILGLGIHGYAEEAFVLFGKMKLSGTIPDHSTFTALLSACSHSGRVDEGWEYFRTFKEEHGLEPRLEQYTCMVDLLGRAGNLEQAYDLILSMPCDPDEKILGSLLSSCRIYSDERLAEIVANRIFELNPDDIGYRVLLANLYEDYEKWGEVDRVRSEIRDKGLKKSPGCSWIEVNKINHVFTSGDCSHEQSPEIYASLGSLTAEIAREGYVLQSNQER